MTDMSSGKIRYSMQKKKVQKKILQNIIQRIVEVAHPERIIMFGSAARGEMGPHSDIDLLVIKKGVRNPYTTHRSFPANQQ